MWTPLAFIDLFNLKEFHLEYGDATAFQDRIAYALDTALLRIRLFFRQSGQLALYTDALSDTPSDRDLALAIEYVVSLIALKTLQEEPGNFGKGPIAEHIEKYTSSVEITKRYGAYGANKTTTFLKERTDTILEELLGPFLPSHAMPYAVSHPIPRQCYSLHEYRDAVLHEFERGGRLS